uniref:Protein kinase domain-containing protein n=1 Tax=Spongospora subterranea TaxID=70186 RepID=A0A0H5R9Q2_9EUKA|eukprot:CRZ10412.1 hypothetical protein [Spongospora subterranea]
MLWIPRIAPTRMPPDPSDNILPIQSARGALSVLLVLYLGLVFRSVRRIRRLKHLQGATLSYRYLTMMIAVHCSARAISFGIDLILSLMDRVDLGAVQEVIILIPEFTALSLYFYIAITWLNITTNSSRVTTNREAIRRRLKQAYIVFNVALAITVIFYFADAFLVKVSVISRLFDALCSCVFVLSLALPIIVIISIAAFFLAVISGFPFSSLVAKKRVEALSWTLMIFSLGRVVRAIMLWLFIIDATWTTPAEIDKFSWVVVASIVLSECLPVLAAQDWKVFALFLIQEPTVAPPQSPVPRWSITSEEIMRQHGYLDARTCRGRWREHDVALHTYNLYQIPKSLIENVAGHVGTFCSINHENIVPLLGVAVVPEGVIAVEEWMPMGNIFHYVQRLSPKGSSAGRHALPLTIFEIAHIMRQITSAMQFLSQRRVVHGFLSCKTILLDSLLNVRIGGVGQYPARQLEMRIRNSNEITGFEAPEIIDGHGVVCPYSDVFSVGCILNVLCNPGINSPAISNVNVNSLSRPLLSASDSPFTQIIQECWASHPQDRPTFSELHHMFSAFDGSMP